MAPIKTFIGKFAKTAFTVSAPSSSSSSGSNSLTQSPTSTTVGDVMSLEQMCKLFKATPIDNLYLSTADGGERGVCLQKPVKANDVILSIPIESCFRDDEPPRWYERTSSTSASSNENDNEMFGVPGINIDGDDDEGMEHDITDYERYNPSAWASRLAASVLDMDLNNKRYEDDTTKSNNDITDRDLQLGRTIWKSMLPPKDILRASLPVHWGEEVLSTSKCTALEMAVDSAYFARATTVLELSNQLKEALEDDEFGELQDALEHDELGECINNSDGEGCLEEMLLQQKVDDDVVDIVLDMEGLQRKCHDALDIVQTRACRVERKCEDGINWGPPLRILAPIFDFINHASSRTSTKQSADEDTIVANAAFGIENEHMCDMHEAKLVVRALRDMTEGEEVLIDYGDSARPAWRCLTSYGFVPEYDVDSSPGNEEEENIENVAELWMNGLRFEVDPHSVPFDLVEVAAAQALLDKTEDDDDLDEEYGDGEGGGAGMLTPMVARAISKRATEAAFNLITEPEMVDSEEDWDSPEFVHAASLAALLRWSQHKVLLAFAENLNMAFMPQSSSEAE